VQRYGEPVGARARPGRGPHRGSRRPTAASATGAALLLLAACSGASFGPPQLLRIERGGETVEFAVATWSTEDVAPVVSGLASALSAAAASCGAEVEPGMLEGAVEDGVIHLRAGYEGCLAAALAGARVGPAGPATHLRIQARPGVGARR
jgi:hypothetical protein